MRPVVRRERALYVQIADVFRRLIAQQSWPVGMRLPTVEELAEQHGVARITVRQAMDILAREGLIDRSRGRATTVLKAPAVSRWHKLTAAWDDFMHSVEGSVSEVLEQRRATTLPEVAPSEGRYQGSYRFLRVIGRRKDSPPLVVREVYVQEPVYRKIKSRLPTASLVGLFGEHARHVLVRNEIAAASVEIARFLQIPVGTPVLEGRHVGTNGEGAIVFVEFPVLRGDYVKFEISVSR